MTKKEKIEKLRELIKGIDIAMLTTIDEDGTLRSRPMGTQEAEFDGDLWFFTLAEGGKVAEIQHDKRVNVSYAGRGSWVSVSGNGRVVNDKAKMKELWSPIYNIYFKDGLDDPKLRLLKIEVEKAEYWDTPGGLISMIISFAQTLAGKESEPGENEKITLKSGK
jgi:general stress protein 26